jgi:putative hydrolase of the HAD superfamily
MRKLPAVDWSAIDTVLLDMDGTLLDLRFDNWFWQELIPRRYAAAKGLSQEETRGLLAPKFIQVKGTLQWYCIEYWTRELGLDIGSIKREALREVRFLPGAEEFLLKLKDSGKRRVLVTNAHPETLGLKSEQVALGQYSLSVLDAARDFGIAWLRAVRLPDSSRPPQPTGDYAAVDRVADLM